MRRRHLAAVVILGLVVCTGLAALVLPILARLDRHGAAVAALDGTLATLARLAVTPGPLSDDRVAEAQALMVPADQRDLALATLQGLLSQRAAAAGARLLSIQVDQAEAEGFVRLVADISFEAPIEAVTRFLYAIETGGPLLVVRRVVIRDPDGGPYGGAVAGPNRLEATLTVEGYWRGRPQP